MALRGIITLFPQITSYKWTEGTVWNYKSVSLKLQAISGLMALRGIIQTGILGSPMTCLERMIVLNITKTSGTGMITTVMLPNLLSVRFS